MNTTTASTPTPKDICLRARTLRHGYPKWLDPEVLNSVFAKLLVMCEPHVWDMTPVTAMPEAAFQAFIRDGVYKTVYQTGPTWHTKYAPPQGPIVGREWNDLRLFGARSEHTAYAIGVSNDAERLGIQHSSAALFSYLKSFASDKRGVRFIKWKPDVLDHATVCYGDCQQGVVVFPYTPQTPAAIAALIGLARVLDARAEDEITTDEVFAATQMFGRNAPVTPNHYFELQIHKTLTPDDMDGVFATATK